jgi:hypothetical protein
LLFWAATDILLLPSELHSLLHHLHERSAAATSVLTPEPHAQSVHDYWLRSYLLSLLSNLIRIVAWILAAGWFYRCGPRVQKFFLQSADQGELDSTLAPSQKK